MDGEAIGFSFHAAVIAHQRVHEVDLHVGPIEFAARFQECPGMQMDGAAVAGAAHDHAATVIVGQSLGAALALAVAGEGGCAAVVAISTPAPDPDALDGLEWRRSRGHAYSSG